MEQSAHFEWLVQQYFSAPERLVSLQPGEILMHEGSFNDRLYLICEGDTVGYVKTPEREREEIFTAGKNTFLGVYSFFSKTFKSILTIEAISPCKMAYIDRAHPPVPHSVLKSLEEQFMPLVVTDLMNRQKRVQELTEEKHKALNLIIESEKFTSLGQMAAGIAHELNNAISVLSRNTNWLAEMVSEQWQDNLSASMFEAGLLNGRFLSSRDVRRRKKELKAGFRLSDASAEMLAQTGLSDSQVRTLSPDPDGDAEHIYRIWEMGATFRDMMVAAEQSAHVVQSVKLFGARGSVKDDDIDIIESIENALTLLRHKLKTLTVNLDLHPLPLVRANMGELVQVWTNLLNNACEAVNPEEGIIGITTQAGPADIRIQISDNGSGIPEALIEKVFQPNVTTKVSGLSFGLGLGLPTVKRIIAQYKGTIDVESSPGGTRFNISLPYGGDRG